MEYDPETFQPLNDFVQVSDAGVIESWCWVLNPVPHPSAVPFAWAMIKLDGADISMIHHIVTMNEIGLSLVRELRLYG